MFAEVPGARLLRVLERPDLRVVAADRHRIAFDPTLDAAFRVDRGGRVVLGGTCLGHRHGCAFYLRHALELSLLLDGGTDAAPEPSRLMLAALCAARVAARFWLLEASPEPDAVPVVGWIELMAGAFPPSAAALGEVWSSLRHLHDPVPPRGAVPDAVLAALAECWPLLGPVETLMATGGDNRLAVDPRTGLNHYGCSHRPRPWAVTFASSTASSLSERGFGGAEASRQRIALAALSGASREALRRETERVRTAIARHWGMAPDQPVVLAASGTDLEMIALALCVETNGARRSPVSNVLVAPEETGTGVPLAAAGRHFASDTARGRPVRKGEVVDGFPADTSVLPVPIRDERGELLSPERIDRTCEAVVEAERALGRKVLVHRLDLSKTGLLAPGMGCLQALCDRFGEDLEVVVDACQARLDAVRVRDYLRRGWMVMVTGSKFFTGPPFCGALLLPARLGARLAGADLPGGLQDYGSAADWPAGAAVTRWPDEPNAGMVLRWGAALAEMRAFAAVPPATVVERAERFIAGLDAVIAASPDVYAVPVPAPCRDAGGNHAGGDHAGGGSDDGGTAPGWDVLQTIRSFLVLAPGPEPRTPLAVPEARRVYRWLNADISVALSPDAPAGDRALARLLCHIGQPAPVADGRLPGVPAGALRISVGARLISGEPSHAGMEPAARMRRELADAERVIGKIGLLLRCWEVLLLHDPEPRFALRLVPADEDPVLADDPCSGPADVSPPALLSPSFREMRTAAVATSPRTGP